MRKLLFILALFCAPAFGQLLSVNGDCTLGGQAIIVQNQKGKGTIPLANSIQQGPVAQNAGVMASYPGCTVTVYITGTTTTVSLFSDPAGSNPIPDPFTANTTNGQWLFFAASGTYDVVLSGASMPTPRTYTALQPGGGGGGGGGAFLPLAGGTMTGKEITAVPTSITAMLNLPPGTAPNVCVNGDVWSTTLGLFTCVGGVAIGPLGTGNGSITSVGLTVPTGFSVTGSPLTGAGGTLNINTSGLTTNTLIKAIAGGLGNSLATEDGTNMTYTGVGGFFAKILTATGQCPGSNLLTGCFDVGLGTAPGNPPSGYDRFYGDSASGNVLCKTSAGNPCFASAPIYIFQVGGISLTAGDTVNLNNTTPTAPANGRNVQWQKSTASTTDSVSAALVGNGNAATYLDGTGNYTTPAGTGVTGSGTTNNVTKWTSSTALGNSQVTDDGTNPTRSPLGFNAASAGSEFEVANNAATGTTVQTMECNDGTGKGIICSHLTSTTNVPYGATLSGAGTTGSAIFCPIGFCVVKFDNSTTIGHWAIESSTVDGQLHDTGATTETAGQPNYYITSANGGAGNAATYMMLTPDQLSNAAAGTKVQVNGTATQSKANFNDTTPAKGSNGFNVLWQTSVSGSTTNISASAPAQYAKLRCSTGLGDGLNAMTAGTYLMLSCVNDSGVTWTVTGIHCFTDNAGSSTLDVKNNAGTSFLTGAVTCNATKTSGGASGTQSGTTTLANTDAFNFTFVADGTSKTTTWTISLTQ